MARSDGLGIDLDPTEMVGMQLEQGTANKGDASLFVRFFLHPHQDAEQTLAKGRPIFHDREYIEIVVPGDKDNTVNRPVRRGDAERFPKQYSSFKAGEVDVQVGTPLGAWAGVTRAQVEEMKYFRIHTVEQLANVPDAIAQRFMGINTLKQKAKDFIDAAQGFAQTDQLREEISARDARIMALEAAVQELMADKAKKPAKKKAPALEPDEEKEEDDQTVDLTER